MVILGDSGAGAACSNSSSITSSTVGTYAGCVRGKRITLGGSGLPITGLTIFCGITIS